LEFDLILFKDEYGYGAEIEKDSKKNIKFSKYKNLSELAADCLSVIRDADYVIDNGYNRYDSLAVSTQDYNWFCTVLQNEGNL